MKKRILFAVLCVFLAAGASQVQAESLFSLNTTYTNYVEPRPLFGTVRARNVGDLITIVLDEKPAVTDKGIYETQKSSSVFENLSQTINTIFKTNLSDGLDGTAGSINVKGNTATQRQLSMQDRVAVQVVQVLPNGNLLVQGKKSLVNTNERVDLLVSGVVDPRWLNQTGEIASNKVANLQFALNGSGTVTRGQNEGVINKFIRMVF